MNTKITLSQAKQMLEKKECSSTELVQSFINQATSQEIAYFLQKVAEIANQQCPKGFRLITNNGSDALQTVEHFHVHILGGEKLGALIGI